MNRFLLLVITAINFAATAILTAQSVYIPDTAFRKYSINNHVINTNGDDTIQVVEAQDYKGNIDCAGNNIFSLVGIEAFNSLTALDCSNNNLTSLDVSKNVELVRLYCEKNQLLSLNLTNGFNKNFKEIIAHGNPNLACIQVDNPAYSYRTWLKKYNFAFGYGISFSKSCVNANNERNRSN